LLNYDPVPFHVIYSLASLQPLHGVRYG